MTQIFVSYSHEDRPLTRDLVDQLRQAINSHDSVWFDERIVGGIEWWSEILKQIHRADIFVFLLSPSSIKSAYCLAELREALRLRKPIVPLEIRPISPESLTQENTQKAFQRLQKIQILDLKDGLNAKNFANIMAAVRHQEENLRKRSTAVDPTSSMPVKLPDFPPPDKAKSSGGNGPLIALVIVAVVAIIFGAGTVITVNGDSIISIVGDTINQFFNPSPSEISEITTPTPQTDNSGSTTADDSATLPAAVSNTSVPGSTATEAPTIQSTTPAETAPTSPGERSDDASPDCIPIIFGEPVSGSIDIKLERDCYSFSAVEGDRIELTVILETSDLTLRYWLWDASGDSLYSPTFGDSYCGENVSIDNKDSVEYCDISTDGVYRLLFEDTEKTRTGSYTFVVRMVSE